MKKVYWTSFVRISDNTRKHLKVLYGNDAEIIEDPRSFQNHVEFVAYEKSHTDGSVWVDCRFGGVICLE